VGTPLLYVDCAECRVISTLSTEAMEPRLLFHCPVCSSLTTRWGRLVQDAARAPDPNGPPRVFSSPAALNSRS
jgi:hypothetical protein